MAKHINLGSILAAAHLVTGVIIIGLWVDKHLQNDLEAVREQASEQQAQMQLALAEKSAELRALQDRLEEVTRASRGIGLLDIQPGKWETFTATWYAEGGINGNGYTATGGRTNQDWTVAVDPRVIPLGSIIQVQFADGTTKVYQALDTGGAIKGKRIDIYDPDLERCFRNGVQTVKVRILLRGGR
jgi:3D (Asp-Asp-Asp) domain-containing protein